MTYNNSEKLEGVLSQWIEKGCIDPHTELLAKSMQLLIKEQERTNLLLLEILNRQATGK